VWTRVAIEEGWTHLKMKVGGDLSDRVIEYAWS
jgi:hypothetical protein